MGNCCGCCRAIPVDDPCQYHSRETEKTERTEYKHHEKDDKEEDTDRDRERAVVKGECAAKPMENGLYMDYNVWQTFLPSPREGVLNTMDHLEKRKKMGKTKDEKSKKKKDKN